MMFCASGCGFYSIVLTTCQECGAAMEEVPRCPGCKFLLKNGAYWQCRFHRREIFNPDMAGCDERRINEL